MDSRIHIIPTGLVGRVVLCTTVQPCRLAADGRAGARDVRVLTRYSKGYSKVLKVAEKLLGAVLFSTGSYSDTVDTECCAHWSVAKTEFPWTAL